MPSSTSNSKSRIIGNSFCGLWPTAIAFALLFVLSLELGLRNFGFRPSITDDKWMWAIERNSVYQTNGQNVLVFVGSSHAHAAVNPILVESILPTFRVVNLSIAGKGDASAVLNDLATDENFKGIVVYDAGYSGIPSPWAVSNSKQHHFVEFYQTTFSEGWSANEVFDRKCWTFLQKRFCFLQDFLRVDRLAQKIAFGELTLQENYATMNDRRDLDMDFSKVDLDDMRERRSVPLDQMLKQIPKSPSTYLEQSESFEKNARLINERGGRIVMLFFPESGLRLKADRHATPKKLFWDTFAKSSSATWIHSEEFESLKKYRCPDWSHLDQKDSDSFSKDLIEELVNLRIIRKWDIPRPL